MADLFSAHGARVGKGTNAMAHKIDEIQGVGAAFKKKLEAARIQSVEDLLERCANLQGRVTTAAETGIDEKQLLKWANLADLMRIQGVGPQYAELLEAAGVDTIKELRTRMAQTLTTKLTEVNGKKKLAKTSPTASIVQEWIEQAKRTEPRITF